MNVWTLCECIFVTFQNLKKNIKNFNENVIKNVLICEEKICIKMLVYYLSSAKKSKI